MPNLELSRQQLREVLRRVTALSLEYLKNLDSRRIFPGVSGKDTTRKFDARLPERGLGMEALDSLRDVVRASRAQNGRFFGYVMGSGEPVAAFAELLAGVLNQNVTSWRSAPAAATIERTVVRWLAEAVGCKSFSGSLTGGGSSANLMGLAMAREAVGPANEAGAPRGIVYASSEAHMSIPKAVALLGLGRRNLRLIEVDSGMRMSPGKLEAAIRSDLKRGRRPLAVVATAGTVNTGTIDPLGEAAEIARRHELWFHVDGAYGGLAAIAAPEKFEGLSLADSVSLDPHKWLYTPLDCGCLLYRDRGAARNAFAHAGDYAKSLESGTIEAFTFFDESVELSRRFRALKLWLSLRFHGLEAFREAIRRDLAHARGLTERIAGEPRLELLAAGELSAVCFRYTGGKGRQGKTFSAKRLDERNRRILERVVRRGRVYLSNATIRGKFALRACFVNHRTSDADVEEIVREVLRAAGEAG